MRTTRELVVRWGVSRMRYETTIPEGTPVKALRCGNGDVFYVVGPERLNIEPNSFEHHDATHHGIPIPADAVEA